MKGMNNHIIMIWYLFLVVKRKEKVPLKKGTRVKRHVISKTRLGKTHSRNCSYHLESYPDNTRHIEDIFATQSFLFPPFLGFMKFCLFKVFLS